MMTTRHRLVDEYLERLEAAAQRLSVSRRIELLNDMREHITVTLAENEATSEAEIRQLLDRLGDPEEIVTAALAEDPLSAGLAAQPSTLAGHWVTAIRGRELLTVLCFLLGGLASFIGFGFALVALVALTGVLLLWMPNVWSRRDKLVGTLAVLAGYALVALAYGVGVGTAGPFGTVFPLLALLGTGIYLLVRARRH